MALLCAVYNYSSNQEILLLSIRESLHVITKAQHWTLSSARSVNSSTLHKVFSLKPSFMFSSKLPTHIYLPSNPIPWDLSLLKYY